MWLILALVVLNIAFSSGCLEYDVDYLGNDIQEGQYVPTSTAQKCQMECQRNSLCNFWTWDRTYHNACWMKSAKTSTSHKSGSGLVSGPKYCDNPPPPSSGCFDYDVDYQGHDLQEGHYVSTSTAEKCQTECQRNSRCNFWTWDRNYHNACWMKSAKTSTGHKSGLVSGPKYCGDNPPSPGRNPKRGVAFAPENFKCEDFALFSNMGWFYNWGTRDPQHNSQCNGANIPDGFVPMIWGKTNNLPDYVKNYDTVLGFNEPNFDNQANMSPETAAHEWIKLQNYYKDQILVSPAAAPPHETDWFDRFFATCRELGCRIDYLATHLYTGNADYDKKHLKELYDRYGLKIWLTEFAKPSTFSVQDEMNYLREMLPYLDNSDHIYRYSWFVHRFTHTGSGHGWYLDKAISLMKPDRSELTELGKFYNEF